jgi:hypothetical protein
MTLAHRVAFCIANPDAVLSPKDIVMHVCDNPPCCNPAHLRVGTAAENNADRDRKGRTVIRAPGFGATHPRAKLTDDEVRAIRGRYSELRNQRAVAREFGVAQQTVCRVLSRRGAGGWGHVD